MVLIKIVLRTADVTIEKKGANKNACSHTFTSTTNFPDSNSIQLYYTNAM